MQELLLNGEEITDALYIQVFVTNLRLKYAYKSPKQKQREIKAQARRTLDINDRLRAIQEELQAEDIKKKVIKQLEAEQQTLQEELEEMQQTESNGWVLVDFPCSYAQAKLLEEAMSGFKPSLELDPIKRDQEMNDALLLVQPKAKEVPPKMLIRSGLDAVIWFKCPLKECQRRADGRRLDTDEFGKAEQTFYHVNDALPPVTMAPLCERMEPIVDETNHSSSIVDRIVSFDMQETSLRRWLSDFGVEERAYNLLQEVDASCQKDSVFEQIEKVIENILDNKQVEKESMKEVLIAKLRTMAADKQKQSVTEAEKTAAEQDRSIEDVDMNGTGELSKLSHNKSDKRTFQSKTEHDVSIDPATKSALSNANSQLSIQQQSFMPERDNIDNDFKPVIIELWRDLAKNYKGQMKRIFRNVRCQREQANIHFSHIKAQFLEFLHTLDGKQEILDEFVKSFNEFSDEYPDLREDDQTKEELHQRTDALSDELWEIVEDRKDQAIEFRKKVMESGLVEFNLAFMTTIAQQLMQAEVDKFKTSVQILHDYYHAIEEKLIPEAPPAASVEIAFDTDEPPAVEHIVEGADPTRLESYSYPRLDRLLAMAIKQQVVPDVTVVAAAAGDAKKGGGKKDAKKGAPAAEEEKTIEESVYVKEMREAIKVEKSILRYRLVQVRNWTLQQLRQTRQSSLELYKMLEDWIYVAQKAEMDAIDEMCIVIKDSIEEETKIQSELRINFMDFTVDKGVLNYVTPPPPKHEPKEEIIDTRFSIPQIDGLVQEFETFERASNTGRLLRVQFLYQFFKSRLYSSLFYGGDKTTLPEVLNQLKMESYMALVRNLDPHSTGFIDWRALLSYFILLQSAVPSKAQASAIKALADKDGLISEDKFGRAYLWFERTEGSKDPDYHLPFERKLFVKQWLFRVNATEVNGERRVDAAELVRILRLPAEQRPSAKIFHDFIFADLDPIHA